MITRSRKPIEYAPPKTGGGRRFPVEEPPFPLRSTYQSNGLTKKGDVQVEMGPEHLIEFVKCRDNPLYFAETYCRIISIDEGIVPFKLYAFQKRMLKQYFENRFSLTVTARQMGKTTVVAAFILWFAMFNGEKNCAILANKGTQAQEVVSRIRMMYEYLPFFLQAGVYVYNKQSIEFDNRSRIFSAATSSDSIRGQAVALLYIDEAAFIENDMTFYESTYPVISSGEKSRVIMTSTPKGKRGMFYKIYTESNSGINEYKNLTVTWDHHPKRDQKWRETTIKNTSPGQFAQEFECSFVGSSGTLISSEILKGLAFKNAINHEDLIDEDGAYIPNELADPTLFVYESYVEGHKYVAIADPSEGLGQDSSVCTIIDVTEDGNYPVVAVYKNNYISPLLFPTTIMNMAMEYGNCPVLIEANNSCGGQVAYILYYELEYENVIMTTSDVKGRGAREGGKKPIPGVKTTSRVKAIGCANLKTLIENGVIQPNCHHIIEELGTFIQVGSTYKGDTDCHDDTVMTLVLFSWLIKQDFFSDYTDSNIGKVLLDKNKESIEDQLMPFGYISGEEKVVEEIAEPAFEAGIPVRYGNSEDFEAWMMS